MRAPFAPLPLRRCPEPFDDPRYVFELKYDGFRALAHLDGRRDGRLVSRNGHVFRRFAPLAATLAQEVRAFHAVLDGEVVCLDADGRADFDALFYSRRPPVFIAFDLLALNGADLRALPLLERKRRLRQAIPRKASSVLYLRHVRGRGTGLYRTACAYDLEGIVAKRAKAPYRAPAAGWLKVKNPDYTQAVGRYERFAGRAAATRR